MPRQVHAAVHHEWNGKLAQPGSVGREGNLPIKNTGGVSGKYQGADIIFTRTGIRGELNAWRSRLR